MQKASLNKVGKRHLQRKLKNILFDGVTLFQQITFEHEAKLNINKGRLEVTVPAKYTKDEQDQTIKFTEHQIERPQPYYGNQ